MLMERRTLADLEEVLAERLAVIRGERATDTAPSRAHTARQRKSA
jgi:hypothetical protein